MPKHIYNLKRDRIDIEKKFFEISINTQLPPIFDIRVNNRYIPAILDQGQLGSSGPNEISNSIKYCLNKETSNMAIWQPSRLYIYYYTRLIEKEPLDKDTGISIEGAWQAIHQYGVCNESNWPYNISKYKVQPPNYCITAGKTNSVEFLYFNVNQDINSIKQALFSGSNIIFGIEVYESFESQQVTSTGVIPIPDTTKEQLLGRHCVSLWGYDDINKIFIGMNSWGTNWGLQGYFMIPYKYVLDPSLSSDFWVVKYFKD